MGMPMAHQKHAGERLWTYGTLGAARGIYGERNGWRTQHSVRAKCDERQELDVPEDRQPPFDQLPWKDELNNAVKPSAR